MPNIGSVLLRTLSILAGILGVAGLCLMQSALNQSHDKEMIEQGYAASYQNLAYIAGAAAGACFVVCIGFYLLVLAGRRAPKAPPVIASDEVHS